MKEVFYLCKEEIKKSEKNKKFTFGVVLTGGGSQLSNITDLSDDTNSYKRIKEERFNLHYKGKNINVKDDISLDEFEKHVKGLKINFRIV